MKSATEILNNAISNGLQLKLDGNDLIIESDNDIPDSILHDIKLLKQEIISALSTAEDEQLTLSELKGICTPCPHYRDLQTPSCGHETLPFPVRLDKLPDGCPKVNPRPISKSEIGAGNAVRH